MQTQHTVNFRVLTLDCIKVSGDYLLFDSFRTFPKGYKYIGTAARQMAQVAISNLLELRENEGLETRIIVHGEIEDITPTRCALTIGLYGDFQ